ncbi:MAG: ribosomal RNA small subunit methyltransferase A [Planctomycetes bacterium]|nr:ribosomal RNA small subunit methyltransferase A [Planctomycetota bacterium]
MTGPLERLKEALEARGLKPRKAFGQNFLVDPNFAKAVAHAAHADGKTLVLEVGPGTGALTSALLISDPAARVLAVEIDRGLAQLLRDTFAQEIASGRLTLLEGDALSGKHELNAEMLQEMLRISEAEQRPRRVLCANLPYNAATSLIANLTLPLESSVPDRSAASPVERIVATVQLELAERFFGTPGSNDFGPLAALLALRGKGSIARKVGAHVFWPRPQVSSAVVELDLIPWERCALKPHEAKAFQEFLQKLFQQRRKTLRAAMKTADLLLAPSDERGAKRAEDLDPKTLLELFRITRPERKK